jgi:hypothetical protein
MKERQCTLKPVQKGGGKHKDWLRPSEKTGGAKGSGCFAHSERQRLMQKKNAFTGK